MSEHNIDRAEQALRASRIVSLQENNHPAIMDTGREVETSLTYLLKHRINKIQDDITFEDQIKEAIIRRLAEADFRELVQVLGMVQGNSNDAVGKLLAPFIPKTDRVPLIDSDRNKELNKGAGELAFENAPKEVLQALSELSRLMEVVKENSATSTGGGASTAEDEAEAK
jgi:hypothetical protein